MTLSRLQAFAVIQEANLGTQSRKWENLAYGAIWSCQAVNLHVFSVSLNKIKNLDQAKHKQNTWAQDPWSCEAAAASDCTDMPS